jgi:cell division protein FtsN
MAAPRKRPKSQARRDSDKRSVPVWIWLMAGVLLGLALAVAMLIHERGDAPGPLARPDATAPAEGDAGVVPPPPADARKPEEPKKPRYDFYTLLQEREVAVPDKELAERARAERANTTTAPATTASGERFILQAGAYRDLREADAVKARIALAGLKARVEAGEANGASIYRVRLGPYSSAGELEAAKRQLAENGVPETMAIREKKD